MTAKLNTESIGLYDHELKSLIVYQLECLLDRVNTHNDYRDTKSEHNLLETQMRLNTLLNKFVLVTTGKH